MTDHIDPDEPERDVMQRADEARARFLRDAANDPELAAVMVDELRAMGYRVEPPR